MRSVQTRGGGGSFVKMRPARLRTCGAARAAAANGASTAADGNNSQVNVRNLVRAAENLMVEPLRTETRNALLVLRSA